MVLSGRALDTGLEVLFRYKEDGTVEVRNRVAVIPHGAFTGIAKVCKENGLEVVNLPQWTQKVIGKLRSQVLAEVEAKCLHRARTS